MGSTAVIGEQLASVGIFAFSLAFAGDSPKSHAVDSDGLLCTDPSYEQFRASSVFLPLGQRNLRTV